MNQLPSRDTRGNEALCPSRMRRNATGTPGEVINPSRRRYMAWLLTFTWLVSTAASASGTDTGSSAMTSLQTWMMEWIPLGSALLIIACVLGWIAHVVQVSFAIRCVVGLIIIGSASYLVSLFGIS